MVLYWVKKLGWDKQSPTMEEFLAAAKNEELVDKVIFVIPALKEAVIDIVTTARLRNPYGKYPGCILMLDIQTDHNIVHS